MRKHNASFMQPLIAGSNASTSSTNESRSPPPPNSMDRGFPKPPSQFTSPAIKAPARSILATAKGNATAKKSRIDVTTLTLADLPSHHLQRSTFIQNLPTPMVPIQAELPPIRSVDVVVALCKERIASGTALPRRLATFRRS